MDCIRCVHGHVTLKNYMTLASCWPASTTPLATAICRCVGLVSLFNSDDPLAQLWVLEQGLQVLP